MKKLSLLFFVLPVTAFSQIGIGLRPGITYSYTSTPGYCGSESWVGGFLSFEYTLPLPAIAIELSGGYKNSLGFKEKGVKGVSVSHSGINVTGIIKYYLPIGSEHYGLFIGGGFATFLFDKIVNGKKEASGLSSMNGVVPIGLYYKINPKLRVETLLDFDFFVKSIPEENKTMTGILVGLDLGIKLVL